MIRARFKLPSEDMRPTEWPVRYPYWRTGYYDDGITMVAYVESANELERLWPLAEAIDAEEGASLPILFTVRFPKPTWYTEDGSHMCDNQETQQLEAPLLRAFLNGLKTETFMIYEDDSPLLFAEIEQISTHKFTVRTKEGMFFVHRELNDVSGRCYKVHRFNTVLGLM